MVEYPVLAFDQMNDLRMAVRQFHQEHLCLVELQLETDCFLLVRSQVAYLAGETLVVQPLRRAVALPVAHEDLKK